MRELERYDELRIPGYAMSAIVNGDYSGVDDADEREIADFMAYFENRAAKLGGHVIFNVDSEEGYFSNSPEFGLPTDVYDCTILIVK